MKNLYKLFTLTMGLLALSACEADRDSNPVLNEPDTFVLNVPAFASNNVYDLKNSESLELTCTQPDYGIPMATLIQYKFHWKKISLTLMQRQIRKLIIQLWVLPILLPKWK